MRSVVWHTRAVAVGAHLNILLVHTQVEGVGIRLQADKSGQAQRAGIDCLQRLQSVWMMCQGSLTSQPRYGSISLPAV